MQQNSNDAVVVQTFSPNLENILDIHIGFGKAQWKLSSSLACLMLCQGAQTIAIGLVLPIIKKQFHLTTTEQAIGLTLINIGMPLGSLFQGLSDNHGRKNFILINAIILLIFGMISVFSWNFSIFVVSRFFYEVGIGMSLPLVTTYTSEIAPAETRASFLAKLWIIWVAGYFVSCFLGYFFLTHNQWRMVLLILCLPSILSLVLFYLFSRQTLHYLWAKKETDQAYELINYMCEENNQPPLSLQYIEEQIEQDIPEENVANIPMSALFSPKYKYITSRMIVVWLCSYFIYYAVTLLLPTILQRLFFKSQASRQFEYIYLAAMSVLQLGCYAVSPIIMNHPALRRKNSICIGFAIQGVGGVLTMLFGNSSPYALFVLMALIITSNSIAGAVIYIYTAELYETLLRSKAQGVCAFGGRTSVALMGIVGLPATKWLNGTGLYLIFTVLSLFGFWATATIPEGTVKNVKD